MVRRPLARVAMRRMRLLDMNIAVQRAQLQT